MLPINSNQSQKATQTRPAELSNEILTHDKLANANSVSLINGLWFFIGVYGPNSLQLVSEVSMQLESNGLYVIAELLLLLFYCCPAIFQGWPSASSHASENVKVILQRQASAET